jgi:hypothetical protein
MPHDAARAVDRADCPALRLLRLRSSLAARLSKAVVSISTTFKIGDHVRWNSEAGQVTGKIIRVHKEDTDFKGYTHHASADDPQYEIKSDKTDHVAIHKGAALHEIE